MSEDEDEAEDKDELANELFDGDDDAHSDTQQAPQPADTAAGEFGDLEESEESGQYKNVRVSHKSPINSKS